MPISYRNNIILWHLPQCWLAEADLVFLKGDVCSWIERQQGMLIFVHDYRYWKQSLDEQIYSPFLCCGLILLPLFLLLPSQVVLTMTCLLGLGDFHLPGLFYALEIFCDCHVDFLSHHQSPSWHTRRLGWEDLSCSVPSHSFMRKVLFL